MEDRIEFKLLENAVDYLLSAAEHAAADSPRDWKYAILHLAAGLELLLKERLSSEHWSLIFADVNKASSTALKEGEFISVDWKAVTERLNQICGIDFKPSEKQLLEALRRLRNRVQHFEIDVSRESVVPVVASGCHFALSFMDDHLRVKAALIQESLRDIAQHLMGLDEFIEVRKAELKGKLDEAYFVHTCPECLEDALVFGDGGNPHCLFCYYTDAPEEVAGRVVGWNDPRDGTWVIEECPECGGPCGEVELGQYETTWLCFQCGIYSDYRHCSRCGGLYSRDGFACDACIENLMSRE